MLVYVCICLHTQRPTVGLRQYGAGVQVGPEEREVLTTTEPSHPVACMYFVLLVCETALAGSLLCSPDWP